jgi:hypothetical protein
MKKKYKGALLKLGEKLYDLATDKRSVAQAVCGLQIALGLVNGVSSGLCEDVTALARERRLRRAGDLRASAGVRR